MINRLQCYSPETKLYSLIDTSIEEHPRLISSSTEPYPNVGEPYALGSIIPILELLSKCKNSLPNVGYEGRGVIINLEPKEMTPEELRTYDKATKRKRDFAKFFLSMVALMWLVMNATVFMVWEQLLRMNVIGLTSLFILVIISMFAGEYHILYKIWQEYLPKTKRQK